MATPKPLGEVAQQFGVSERTMWKLVARFRLQKHRMPGRGKAVYLDPDELRRKWRAVPIEPKPPDQGA